MNQRSSRWLLVAAAMLLAACNTDTSMLAPEVSARPQPAVVSAQAQQLPGVAFEAASVRAPAPAAETATKVVANAHARSRYAMAAN